MYQAIAAILVILTICVCVTKPQLHKTVFIYDSKYTIAEPQKDVEEIKNLPTMTNQVVEEKVLPKTETVATVEKTPTKVQPVKTAQKTASAPQTQTVKTETVAVQPQTVQKVETQNPLLNVLTERKTEQKPEVKIDKVETNKEPAKIVEKKEGPKIQTVQTTTQEEREKQELIMWNVWRSNLQNKIMKDTKLPIIPEGTVFRFSFDVDKYGKISNVQTWSLTPAYTPYAIQYIAPVIRSYQGREILNFPEGSNRISTTVEGGWKISKTAKFSTPADYKDSEKVISK